MRTITRLAAAITTCVIVALGGPALASCPSDNPPEEVQACWSMDEPDLSSPHTAQFPQTYVGETCPDSIPGCDSMKYQHDWYWIRDAKDEVLLSELIIDGLNRDENGRPQDGPLEPHNVSITILHGTGVDHNGDEPGCGNQKAVLKLRKFPSCNPQGRFVEITKRAGWAKLTKTHGPHRQRWVINGTTKDGWLFHGETTVHKVIHLRHLTHCGTHSS